MCTLSLIHILLGAIRLPNDAFKKNAGAEVVSDIIFLQKRDRPLDIMPEWTQTGQTEDCLLYTSNKWWAAKKKQPTKAVVSALLNDGCVRVTRLYSEKTGKTYDATAVSYTHLS